MQGLSITMPKPSNKPSTEKHDLKIVQVTPEGSGAAERRRRVAWPSSKHSSRSREGALTRRMSVAIKGDPRSKYASVVAVIDLCNRLQVNMGLVTSKIGT